MRFYAPISLLLLLVALACQVGSATFYRFSGSIPFAADTVFAWKDPSIEQPSTLHVMMSWLNFDPDRDFNEFDKAYVAKMHEAFRNHSSILLTFENSSLLASHTHWEQGHGLKAYIQLEGERLSPKMYGSMRTVDVSLDQVVLENAPYLSGRIDIYIKRSEEDPKEALEGHLRGKWKAPILKNNAIVHKNAELLLSNF